MEKEEKLEFEDNNQIETNKISQDMSIDYKDMIF